MQTDINFEKSIKHIENLKDNYGVEDINEIKMPGGFKKWYLKPE